MQDETEKAETRGFKGNIKRQTGQELTQSVEREREREREEERKGKRERESNY